MGVREVTPTRLRIVEAARARLLVDGFANLSTRGVAKAAQVPLSQIHYHFGGRPGLVLAVLEEENRRLVERQRRLYGAEEPLWKRYDQACAFLEDDLTSGYVRVLQEMVAAGWSDPAVATQVLGLLRGWFDVLQEVAQEAEDRFGSLGPLRPTELATLVGLAFLGGETVILLGDEAWGQTVRAGLRSLGALIRVLEEA